MINFSFVSLLSLLLIAGFMAGCSDRKLPILGEPVIAKNNQSGKSDTTYPTIASFSFTDQENATITNQTFSNKIYVADFIFLSCPSICPQLTGEMKKLYARYGKEEHVVLLSHTIDPQHDSVGRLAAYAKGLGVRAQKWHFVTGNKDSIYRIAKQSYYTAAFPDSADPGNFVHSGGLLLVDKNRHLRGVYDGTDPRSTEKLISDIQILLKEEF